MKGRAEDSNPVMIGQTDWYAQAGKRPFIEDGFSPELMMRIEQAATNKTPGYKRYRINKSVLLTSLAMILLIVVLNLPMGVWKSQGPVQSSSVQSQAGGILPTSSPDTNDKALDPPVGSALFEISGKKYYMPLPLDRNKEKAYAVETTSGILWSPPPPMVDYKKPKYTHPTEPFTLYLSSKDQAELSASSATRIYTFPLYAGSASTYQYLNGFYGAGDYILLTSSTRTLGSDKLENGRISMLNVKKAVAGETVVPKELTNFDETLLSYKYLFAVDKEYEYLVISYLEYPVDKKYQDKTVLYDLETLSIRTTATTKGFKEIEGETLTMDYEVDGKLRKADIIVKGGLGWINEDWAFLSEEQRNALYQEFMSQTP
ncbi:hypothetical protein [Paenibacillus sp. FSL R10-2734]|uniref:hypothetical protein n=1 Tax=Paenibacillus sp. FSL R10-2734 TaxID=2954691 RepID=UPI0030D8D331